MIDVRHTISADKSMYEIIAVDSSTAPGTVPICVGSAKRDEKTGRVFEFTPTELGRDRGLKAEVYDRMRTSPAGLGLTASIAQHLNGTAPAKEVVAATKSQPKLRRVKQAAEAEATTLSEAAREDEVAA